MIYIEELNKEISEMWTTIHKADRQTQPIAVINKLEQQLEDMVVKRAQTKNLKVVTTPTPESSQPVMEEGDIVWGGCYLDDGNELEFWGLSSHEAVRLISVPIVKHTDNNAQILVIRDRDEWELNTIEDINTYFKLSNNKTHPLSSAH